LARPRRLALAVFEVLLFPEVNTRRVLVMGSTRPVGDIAGRDRLDGLIHEYERKAM
jgi:hypothetical protein